MQRVAYFRDLRIAEYYTAWNESPAYNLVFFLPPTDNMAVPWFVDLIPRFPQFAGFELATDCWINPVSPERTAQMYLEQASSLSPSK